MKRLEEQEVRRLLETPPAALPPEDLADLLKAQIPDPLPQWDEDETAPPSPEPSSAPPLSGPWLRKPWRAVGRLAAALVAMFGVGALSLQLLQWSDSRLESPAAFDVASQTESSQEADRGAKMKPDDVLSEPMQMEPVPEGAAPEDAAPESVPEGAVFEATHPATTHPATTTPESSRLEPDRSEPATIESSGAAVPQRAKRAEAPLVLAETQRRIDAPMEESSSWNEASTPETAGVQPAPALEPLVNDRADSSLDAAATRARRGSPGVAASQQALLAEATALEASSESSPWTLTERAPRTVWQPSAVDAADFDGWRQRLETEQKKASWDGLAHHRGWQAPPVDAALMTFGALSGSEVKTGELRLEVAPSPYVSRDPTFWLLVEAGQHVEERSAERSPAWPLGIELSPKAVARYQILAGGFDEKTGVRRLLMALQLMPPSVDSADDVLVEARQVKRATGQATSRDAAVHEKILRRRDIVSSWSEATWPYRVQTVGVGLVQAVESSLGAAEDSSGEDLLRRVQELSADLGQNSKSELDEAPLKAWLDWLVSTSESEN